MGVLNVQNQVTNMEKDTINHEKKNLMDSVEQPRPMESTDANIIK